MGQWVKDSINLHKYGTAMHEIEHGQWPPWHVARPRCCEVVTVMERNFKRHSAETLVS
jgi:hypothetical protein